MDITEFLILDSEGDEIIADAHGTHVAFCCAHCGAPVLASACPDQRGGAEEHPAQCQVCGAGYFLDVRAHVQKLYIHRADA